MIKAVLIGRDRVRSIFDYFDGLDLTRNYAIIASTHAQRADLFRVHIPAVIFIMRYIYIKE